MPNRAFVDSANGSVYVTEFSTAAEATAYVPPSDRQEIAAQPTPAHNWDGSQWIDGRPAILAEEARIASVRSDAGRIDLLARLRAATPQQIDTYIDNNVTTLPQARTLFKAILKLIALDARG